MGPLKEGKDLELERTVKYMLLAAVPVPYEMDHKSCEVEEKMEEAKDPGELEDKEKDGAGEEEEEDVLEKLRDEEISGPAERIPDQCGLGEGGPLCRAKPHDRRATTFKVG